MGRAGKQRIIIAGGGLGGLAAAVALLERGFQVVIFEKSPELREVGAGLSVWPNATLVLKKLGLLEDALRHSEPIKRLRLSTWRGTRLLEIGAPGNYDTPAICIHRADLMSVLKSQVSAESVHLGERLVRFEDDGSVVTAHFPAAGSSRVTLSSGRTESNQPFEPRCGVKGSPSIAATRPGGAWPSASPPRFRTKLRSNFGDAAGGLALNGSPGDEPSGTRQ